MNNKTDILIVGTGVAGLFAALTFPKEKEILMITKSDVESSDSFLAQGGICVLKGAEDYEAYFHDTMKAGHFKNDPRSVEIMIRSSRDIIKALVDYGVDFEKQDGEFLYTREGAHSKPRILYHQDITGREITSKLLAEVKKRGNIKIEQNVTMVDIIENNGEAAGVYAYDKEGNTFAITADYTILASGGIGGLYENSTNFRHLTGDALAICLKHNIALRDVDYIQIHPTTLYSEKQGRRFLISESVRGEGAVLLDKNGKRFVNELLPRDIVTQAIFEQMKKDGTPYVMLSLEAIGSETIKSHFPNIYKKCLEEGYDVTEKPIPVVPAQHYFMGGIDISYNGATSMPRLYAAGETSCSGVHGANRLASNSLLESLVFAKRAAGEIISGYKKSNFILHDDIPKYDIEKDNHINKQMILTEIERTEKNREQ
ncbi:MAG: L-aspartate oxidase [Bacillota bacterium]|nr:L-aspartate oxidase [Bacillota bacterium]